MCFDEICFRSYDIQMLVVHDGLWQRGGFREASLDPPPSACQRSRACWIVTRLRSNSNSRGPAPLAGPPHLSIPGGWNRAFRLGGIANVDINGSRTCILEGYDGHGTNCIQISSISALSPALSPSALPPIGCHAKCLTFALPPIGCHAKCLTFALPNRPPADLLLSRPWGGDTQNALRLLSRP